MKRGGFFRWLVRHPWVASGVAGGSGLMAMGLCVSSRGHNAPATIPFTSAEAKEILLRARYGPEGEDLKSNQISIADGPVGTGWLLPDGSILELRGLMHSDILYMLPLPEDISRLSLDGKWKIFVDQMNWVRLFHNVRIPGVGQLFDISTPNRKKMKMVENYILDNMEAFQHGRFMIDYINKRGENDGESFSFQDFVEADFKLSEIIRFRDAPRIDDFPQHDIYGAETITMLEGIPWKDWNKVGTISLGGISYNLYFLDGVFRGYYFVEDASEVYRVISAVELLPASAVEHGWEVDSLHTLKGWRREGIAQAMYTWIVLNDRPLLSGYVQSRGASKMWRKLGKDPRLRFTDMPNQWMLERAAEKDAYVGAADLLLTEITEEGRRFVTGVPVRFPYIRNLGATPHMGSRYGQDIEPTGRYMSYIPKPRDAPRGWETGWVEFNNPLVLAWVSYEVDGWKARLSRHYRKTGKALSRAIIADGYDGIVTVTLKARHPYVSEVVDLTTFRSARMGGMVHYPGKVFKVSPEMKKQFKIRTDPGLPDYVAARYMDNTDVLLIPGEYMTDQLLEHELTHRDWWQGAYSRADKKQWNKMVRKYPDVSRRLWTRYLGSQAPANPRIDPEELLADLVGQYEVGKGFPDYVPEELRRVVRDLAEKEMDPDPAKFIHATRIQ